MNPEKWKKIKELFAEAVELPMAERTAFLDQNCDSEIRAEVEKMLEMDEDDSLETSPLHQFNPIGKSIGKYKVLEEIGRGGMGNVYLAEREDLKQKVALKIIKKGLDSEDILRRFKHESEILATLEHPNIARLIDGGTTPDGLPFYTMEFVEGQPIDEFCNNKSLEEKLDLFRQVCKAVAYAHARLVVHRDLKPSNIIVDADGTAKLLDFGIAKILSEDNFGRKGTATSLGMMTPNYASPEQIRGEQVTTATDIYSLGIIVYELLTGVLPYDLQDKTLDKVLEIISKTTIAKPSENPRSKIQNLKLKGDLDTIILKSLQKEPERRYQSVVDFSEDIRRYLVGLPITARPDTFRYRASKFVRRNTVAVFAASLVFLSLIGGLIGIYYQYSIANRQKTLAEKRFADVRELANKVVFRYHDEIAKFSGSTALREELVNDAVKYLDVLAADETNDNQLKLELSKAYQKIGDVQGRPYTANLGKSEDALLSYQKAVDILKNASEKTPKEFELKRELVRAMQRLIALKARLGKNDYQPEIQNTVNLQLEVNQTDTSNSTKNAIELAEVFVTQADYIYAPISERLEIYKKAYELLENIPDKTPEIQHNLVRVNQRLGSNYVWLGDEFAKKGDKEKASENYRNALPYNQKMFEAVKEEIALGGETQNLRRILAGANQNLGENYFKLGEKEKGLEMLQRNLDIALNLAQKDEKNTEAQIDVANSYASFADAYAQFGDFKQAVEADQKALSVLEKQFAFDKKNIELSHAVIRRNNHLAVSLEKTNRTGEASTYRQKNVEMCKNQNNASPCIEIGLVKQ